MNFFSNNRNRQNGGFNGGGFNTAKKPAPQYYEDTHTNSGEYIGNDFTFSQSSSMQKFAQMPSQSFSFAHPKNYQNVVVYAPKNPDDVQRLIDFLKMHEPAIVNLDDITPDDAQRILDFVSGAIYALSGSVHRIASNIFLLSPEGVEITIPPHFE